MEKTAPTTVLEVLTAAIENWPTLHSTRWDALDHVFTNSNYDWSLGYPIRLETSRDEKLTEAYLAKEIEEQVAFKSYYSEAEKSGMIYYMKVELEENLRIRRDAAQIASMTSIHIGKSGFKALPSLSDYQVKHIPLVKLTPEWLAALEEYCNAALHVRPYQVVGSAIARGLNNDYQTRELDRLKAAQETCKRVLEEIKMIRNPGGAAAMARKAKIDALQKAAAELGYDMTPMSDRTPG